MGIEWVMGSLVYFAMSVLAGGYAYIGGRPRDVVLLHILLGPLFCVLILLREFIWLLGQVGLFLLGAWSDFRDRFR